MSAQNLRRSSMGAIDGTRTSRRRKSIPLFTAANAGTIDRPYTRQIAAYPPVGVVFQAKVFMGDWFARS